MTKLEIIYELFESKEGYINKPETRALLGKKCQYKTQDNKMCAVGKCLIPNDKIYIFEGNVLNLVKFKVQKEENFDSLLQEKYRGYEIGFWLSLQDLHDNYNYWKDNNQGITEQGLQFLNDLKERYS